MEVENPRAVIGGNEPPPSDLAEILRERNQHLFLAVDPIAARANLQPQEITTDEQNFALGEVIKDAGIALRGLEAVRVTEKAPYLAACRTVDETFKVGTSRLEKIIDRLGQRASKFAHAKKVEARRLADEEAKRLRDEEERQREIARRADEAGRAKTAAKHGGKAEDLSSRAEAAEKIATTKTADLTRTSSDTGLVATASDKWDFRVADWSKVDLAALRPFIAVEALEKALRAHMRIHKGSMPIAGVEFVEGTKASFR